MGDHCVVIGDSCVIELVCLIILFIRMVRKVVC